MSQSRGMPLNTSQARRPKLMRASATAPALATSNASRKDLASLQSSRASTLLARLQSEHNMQGAPNSSCSSPGLRSPSPGSSPSGTNKEPFEISIHQSGNYFSFPNFEDFLEYHDDEEAADSRSEKSR
ncbi:hypothetical protein B7463_g2456, partial [Scytalidium lignicola]